MTEETATSPAPNGCRYLASVIAAPGGLASFSIIILIVILAAILVIVILLDLIVVPHSIGTILLPKSHHWTDNRIHESLVGRLFRSTSARTSTGMSEQDQTEVGRVQ